MSRGNCNAREASDEYAHANLRNTHAHADGATIDGNDEPEPHASERSYPNSHPGCVRG